MQAFSISHNPDLKSVLCLHDFERLARHRLPHALFSYAHGGVEDDLSARENRKAFSRYFFLPQVLRDVTQCRMEIRLWGRSYAAPLGVAPMGLAGMFAYQGELALAGAAHKAQIPMVLSATSLVPLEQVIDTYPDTWFQVYLPGDLHFIQRMLARVRASGCETLVVTVDTPAVANRENNVRAGFGTPLRPTARLMWQGMTHPHWSCATFARTLLKRGMPHFENSGPERGGPVLARHAERSFPERSGFTFEHLEYIRQNWNGRLIVKGILRADDAQRLAAMGVDALVVSNHGGRQLDGTASPLDALGAVVKACPDIPVFLDGGIRRGSDVLKALALGAAFVFIGRPFLYATTVRGEAGVSHAIRLLKEEVQRNMQMLGVTDLHSLAERQLLMCASGKH